MNAKDQVLTLLEQHKGSFISGQEMAEKIFVSRNAVWKAVCKLREEGYIIDAVTKRGYRLAEESNIFSAQSVSAKLGKVICRRVAVTMVDSVDSTNTALKSMAEKGAPEGCVLIAKTQTAGKGRLGRSFYSPEGTGLYMSILLRPKLPAEESLYITTCAAVAVSEACDSLADIETMIKWVNDVYYNGKKVCGILTEASMDFESGKLHHAVCGIGVNLSENGFSKGLKEIAGGILEENKDLRAELAARIIKRFFHYYDKLPSVDFLSEYRRRSLLTGKKITFIQNGEEYSGTAVDIDDKVRLIVKLDNGGEAKLSSGEAIIKKGELIK